MLDTPPSDTPSSAAGPDPFSIAVHPHRRQVIVAPSGDLDLATADRVGREIGELRAVGFDDIVLDLRAVRSLDSSGLRLFPAQQRAARRDGYAFRLVAGPPEVQRLFAITGTDRIFEFVRRPSW